MKRFTMISALAGLGALAAHAGDPADTFSAMDTDGDDGVTQAEFVSWAIIHGDTSADEASAKFARLAGEDDTLTLAELEAAMKAKEAEAQAEEDAGRY